MPLQRREVTRVGVFDPWPTLVWCERYSSPRTGGGRAHPGHHLDNRTRGRGRGRDARGAQHPGPATLRVMPGVWPGASPILVRSQLNRTSTSDA